MRNKPKLKVKLCSKISGVSAIMIYMMPLIMTFTFANFRNNLIKITSVGQFKQQLIFPKLK